MDDDHVKAEQAKGSLKEAIGKLTGNPVTEAEGAAQKSVGQAQAAVAKTKIKDRKSPTTAGDPV